MTILAIERRMASVQNVTVTEDSLTVDLSDGLVTVKGFTGRN